MPVAFSNPEEVDVSKTIFVNGDPFQDFVEHNGAPPTPSEARKQMEKLLKRQTETKAERAARLENEKADRAFVTEVADAFNFASSGKSVGDGERQRAVAVRNRRNFLQVESKDLC